MDPPTWPSKSSSVRIRDVTLKTSQRRWTTGRSRERGSGISVLVARHDDENQRKNFLWFTYNKKSGERGIYNFRTFLIPWIKLSSFSPSSPSKIRLLNVTISQFFDKFFSNKSTLSISVFFLFSNNTCLRKSSTFRYYSAPETLQVDREKLFQTNLSLFGLWLTSSPQILI